MTNTAAELPQSAQSARPPVTLQSTHARLTRAIYRDLRDAIEVKQRLMGTEDPAEASSMFDKGDLSPEDYGSLEAATHVIENGLKYLLRAQVPKAARNVKLEREAKVWASL